MRKSWLFSSMSAQAGRCSMHVSRQLWFLVRQQHNMRCRSASRRIFCVIFIWSDDFNVLSRCQL